jgi:mevalonate kinase
MQRHGYSLPGKTFLLGEYAVTQGHIGLLVTTVPRFTLTLTSVVADSGFVSEADSDADRADIFRGHAPCARFVRAHDAFFRHWSLAWDDPYGSGGFGASCAQLGLCFAAYHRLQAPLSLGDGVVQARMLAAYRQWAWLGAGVAPSGYDLIAQYGGGICSYCERTQRLHHYQWPWPEMVVLLAKTKEKVATHEHLATLSTVDVGGLATLSAQGVRSFSVGDLAGFAQAINDYAGALAQQGLHSSHTQRLLALLQQDREILAVKGCGALGADVVLFLIARQHQAAIIARYAGFFSSWRQVPDCLSVNGLRIHPA